MVTMQEQVCPVVLRWIDQETEALVFRHPTAGNQFMKGPVEGEESYYPPALREMLREQSGLTITTVPRYIGRTYIGKPAATWHFFAFMTYDLPETWDYQTEDGSGHVHSFFWHSLLQDLDDHWDRSLPKVLRFIRRNL